MKPPEKVVSPPRTWAIVMGDPGQMDGNDDGITDFDGDRVIIKASLRRGSMRDSLMHELLHVLFDQLPVKRELKDVREHLEEDIVFGLTPRLLDLLRENPDLVAYLVS